MKRINRISRILIFSLLMIVTAFFADVTRTADDSGSMEGPVPADSAQNMLQTGQSPQMTGTLNSSAGLINKDGTTVRERIGVPGGFERAEAEAGSFGEYLRNLPVKPDGTKVKLYNGSEKTRDVYEAVLDIDTGDRDLQQCADAVIRLRAEYLYGKGLYDRIHFNFTNGFNADYRLWRQGNRIRVEGNRAYWVRQAGASGDYGAFRKYLDIVFAYAGTLSLSQEMKKIPLSDIMIGDVFLKGDNPGHCAIVLDMAENRASGGKCFLLAQSYMPAQDIHILKNPANGDGNPWYAADFGDRLVTPEWEFTKDQLYRFTN